MAALILSISGSVALQSCGEERGMPDNPDNPDYNPPESPVMRISMRVPDFRSSSLAYEAGSGYENYVDVENGDYRIYIFDSSDRLITEFRPLYVEAAGEPGYRDYTLTGHMLAELSGYTEFKIVVLANWGSYIDTYTNGVTTISDICNDTRSVFSRSSLSESQATSGGYIPFYGVRRYSSVKYSPVTGDLNLTEPVTLIRGVAKIVLEFNADESDDTEISGVELIGYNERGYCAPEGVASQDDYRETDSWKQVVMQAIHLPEGENESASQGRRLRFRQIAPAEGDDKKRWELYVPEFRNIETDGSAYPEEKRARIHFKFSGRTSGSQYVDFQFYSDPGAMSDMKKGDYFNIKRNYCYHFSIYRSGDRMNAEVDVIPYIGIDLDAEFGLERDEESGMLIVNKYAPDIYYYDDERLRYYDSDGNEMAHRVRRDSEGIYHVYDLRTRRFRYAYDSAAGAYYVDEAHTVPLTSPEQLTFPQTPTGLLIIRTNDYGESLYFWDKERKVCLDEYGSVVPIPCLAYQKWPHDKSYIVIDYTDVGRYRIVYNPSADRYFMIEDDGNLAEMQAFPPKN
ncbi:MAG: hypothetical protein K2G78_07075 [Muribaculaceae bacterium]|nr:hypothetical protein [Muribaculaceae bacterium]